MIRPAARVALGMVLLASPAAAQPAPEPAKTPAPAASKAEPVKSPAPNAERVLVIGLLDKVSSETGELTLKPGETVRFGKLRITARTCEASPPWQRPHTGAFLQIDGPVRDNTMKRLFSGWLFAESPSLNSFDNERYDVWVKSCAMRFPETGPRTIVVGKSSGRASSAPKSASETPVAPPSN
ncbi:hypothetical protein DFR51_2661 [Sphingosinicella microcystinivorans]|uniref:DUF2155 domain-containing protein n=1 Tax=Sphingosinicella microcystinivorans TaxID=335406 RepID=A0ABX9SWP4_SPHMI|nr:hypothetical protein DFR51_2661 [Sphingosinicella microcystinivorans]